MDIFSMLFFYSVCNLGGVNFIHHSVRVLHKYVFSRGCTFATDMKCPRPELSFWLYTRATKDNPTKLELDSLQTAPFVDAPLKIFILEYGSHKDKSDINYNLIPAYFSRGEYNIISVEFTTLGKKPCYYAAWRSIPTIAHCIGQFFQALFAVRTFSSTHMMGFSLGGQFAAWASNEVEGLTRFTGFDMAFPMFGDKSPLLKKATAKFVDMYYTNSGILGVWDAIGDVNVHYNLGPYQPGCGCDDVCSHRRTLKFFAESITGGQLKAFPCESWSHFRYGKCPPPSATDLVTIGEDIELTTKHGRYLAFTSGDRPYILDPALLLDKTSFQNVKETARGDCKKYKVLLKFYDAFKNFKRSLGFKKD